MYRNYRCNIKLTVRLNYIEDTASIETKRDDVLSTDGSYVYFFRYLSNLDTLLQSFLFGLCCLVCRWVHEEHWSLYTSGDSQFRVFGSKYSSRYWLGKSWKGEDCSYSWHPKGSELLGYRLLWESDKELLTCLDPNNFLKHNFINPQGC